MSKLRNTLPLPSRARVIGRTLASVAAVAVAAFVTACSDAPTSPAPAASAAPVRLAKSGGGAGQTSKVGRASTLAAPVSVSYRIDPAKGGKFSLPGTGLEIEVPKGAVWEPVTITATALPGDAIAYEFQPHGLVFRRPLQARQELGQIDSRILSSLRTLLVALLGGGSGSSQLEIAYFADRSALATDGPVSVNEFLGSVLDFGSDRVEFQIEHFSGYMVAWGRSRYY